MATPSTSCDARLLQRSLDDGLSELQEEALTEHLSSCEGCRRSLERLAAQEPRWQLIRNALRDESHAGHGESGGRAATPADDETIWYGPRQHYASSPADFAVDFLDAPTRPESLGRLGDIDVLEVIGHGGMGIVLKGFQTALNRPVAVKVLSPHLATSGAARQRFAREAQAAAAIVHPNVMPIFTVDGSGKLPYLVMPYINGHSLQERIDQHGALETVDVLRIGLQVARGLAAAHTQGLVHRDVKPANILLERGVDRVLLTDFGLARAADDASLTRTGFIAGTPQYMSPEQARGDSIDARSDLFSLGSVLYTMCTGRPPFRADSSYGVLRRITDNVPRPIVDCQPTVPAWLASLVDRLLAKRAEDRYQSADRVAEILEQCLAHWQQPTHVAVPAELCQRHSPRPFPVAASMITAGILSCVSLGLWSGQTWFAPSPVVDPGGVHTQVHSAEPAPAPQMETTQTLESKVPPIDWNDSLSPDIRQLQNDVRELQRKVDAFWD